MCVCPDGGGASRAPELLCMLCLRGPATRHPGVQLWYSRVGLALVLGRLSTQLKRSSSGSVVTDEWRRRWV